MTDAGGADILINFWKTQVEAATKAWVKALDHAQSADPAQFWRPVMDPAIGAWASLMAKGPVSPDVLAQWKQFLDQWIEAWGEALERAMQTEAFAQALGRYLDQWIAVQAPARQAASEVGVAATAMLGLASRSDVAAIGRQLTDLEDRMDELSEQLKVLVRPRRDETAAAGRSRRARRGTPTRRRTRRGA